MKENVSFALIIILDCFLKDHVTLKTEVKILKVIVEVGLTF